VAVLVGTSGWQYASWRGRFYPAELRQASWLEHYAARFQTVEVNNAFYRLPEASTFASWAARTPDDFVVVVKVSRYLTHVKRLKDPAEPVARFVDRACHLGAKLGPVLLQLPPNLAADVDRLDAALACFPSGVRVAVEFRHPSWFGDDTRSVLERRGAALCLADSPRRETPLWRTADWGYVRFHEGTSEPPPCYGRGALDAWAGRLAEVWGRHDEVFAFFNNDPLGCAPRDASLFADVLRAAGLVPTRVPPAAELAVG
jgi:uncharacterized protein YecE (DUF72 family)